MEDEIDFDAHVDKAHSQGIISHDAQGQEQIHIVDTRDSIDLEFTSAEASTAQPRFSLVKELSVEEIVNYIGLTCSARQNRILLSIFGGIKWVQTGGVYYPIGDYLAAAGQGTVLYRIPAKRGYRFSICLDIGTYAQSYVDFARVIYGYLPDEREQVKR